MTSLGASAGNSLGGSEYAHGLTAHLEQAGFRRSSFCAASECVEVASDGAEVAVRDTADRSGPVLTMPGVAWGRFIERVKAAAFA